MCHPPSGFQNISRITDSLTHCTAPLSQNTEEQGRLAAYLTRLVKKDYLNLDITFPWKPLYKTLAKVSPLYAPPIIIESHLFERISCITIDLFPQTSSGWLCIQ